MRAAGADVWKGKWVFVVLLDGAFERAFICPRFDEACTFVPDAAAIGVDIPIGLPTSGEPRPADLLARRAVGRRWQSVFLAPPPAIMRARSHAEANELARRNGWPGVSAQTFALRHMVGQVDGAAGGDGRVHEVHPEVSFAEANGHRSLQWPKTSWNGQAERAGILASAGVHLPSDLGPAGAAGPADVLDAAIVAWSANRIALGTARCLPPGGARTGSIWY